MTRNAILEHVGALTDPIRSRLLLLLERQELTVSELCTVLQLPQSTTSRHLKHLVEQAWIVARPEGTKRFYRMDLGQLGPTERRLWLLLRDAVGESPAAAQDRGRLESVLRERRNLSAAFFARSEDWERIRRELFGRRFDALALLGLLDETWRVGDLGCGSGVLSEALAPFVGEVVAIDSSSAMLEAARRRLTDRDNVSFREGDLEGLPLDDRELDAATLFLVLHHVANPPRVIAEACRVLKPGGRLLIVDMLPHDRDEYRQEMGHVWLGFSEENVRRHLEGSALDAVSFQPLPADPEAKGPNLFVAVARRAASGVRSAPSAPSPRTESNPTLSNHRASARRER